MLGMLVQAFRCDVVAQSLRRARKFEIARVASPGASSGVSESEPRCWFRMSALGCVGSRCRFHPDLGAIKDARPFRWMLHWAVRQQALFQNAAPPSRRRFAATADSFPCPRAWKTVATEKAFSRFRLRGALEDPTAVFVQCLKFLVFGPCTSIENVTPPKESRRDLDACCIDEIIQRRGWGRSSGFVAAEDYMVLV